MARRADCRLPVALFFVLACIYCVTVNPAPSYDAQAADFASWQLAETGNPVPDLSLFPSLRDSPTRDYWVVVTADGREAVGRAPGVIAASLPAYLVAGAHHRSDLPGGLTAAVLSALSVTLLFQLLRRFVGSSRALVASLLFGLATPVWAVAADAMWPHTLTVLGIVVMAWAASKNRWWLVGAMGGVAMWGRLHVAIAVAIVGIGIAVWRRRPSIAIEVGLTSLAALALMSAWNHWMYGRWSPTAGYALSGYADHALRWGMLVDQLGFWLSPYRGVLVWTPLVGLLLPALCRGWRALPDWARLLPIGMLVYSLVEVGLSPFTGGDHFYGYRHGLEIVTALTPALAMSADHMGRWARRLFVPLAITQFAMILPGAVFNIEMPPFTNPWTSNDLVSGFMQSPSLVALAVVFAVIAGALVAGRWRRWDRATPGHPPIADTAAH